jgi:hypothetical protein
VPEGHALPGADSAGADEAGEGESREIDITKIQRGSRLPWALLLKRVFMTDALTCPKCQGSRLPRGVLERESMPRLNGRITPMEDAFAVRLSGSMWRGPETE